MDKQKNILLLVNPNSGKKTALKIAEQIAEKLSEIGLKSLIQQTQFTNNTLTFPPQLNPENFEKIAVFGGDGTMNGVVNEIMNKPEWIQLPLVLFPCGTGNAFNTDINCLTLQTAFNNLIQNQFIHIDLAQVKTPQQTLWSFNIVGCGLVAHVNAISEKMRWLGTMRYNIASIIGIIQNPTIKAKVTFNNQTLEKEFCFLFACNTQHTGKAMKIAPLAKLNDGLIDFLIVEKTSRLKLLTLFPQIFTGKHINSPLLKYVQCSHIQIETTQNNIINIDGEMKGSTPFELTMHPQKIKILTTQNH